jgi:hypothetical protein
MLVFVFVVNPRRETLPYVLIDLILLDKEPGLILWRIRRAMPSLAAFIHTDLRAMGDDDWPCPDLQARKDLDPRIRTGLSVKYFDYGSHGLAVVFI